MAGKTLAGRHSAAARLRHGRGRTPPRVRRRTIAMTGFEASTSCPSLPRWFGPRANPDDPAVSALIARVARGAGWTDIGGGFNLNVRIDADPPVVLRVHRPWVRRGRVAGLRRLRERLQGTEVRVARPIRTSGRDLLRVAGRWAEVEEFIDHVRPPAGEDSYVRLFEELGRFHTALKAVWEPRPPNLSTTTGPSANCVTRSGLPAAGSDPAASRSCIGCASWLASSPSSGRRSSCRALRFTGTTSWATRENSQTARGPPSTWISRGSGSGCTTSRAV
jgi:hypothetical protein